MFARPFSQVLFSAGLCAIAGTTGCQTTGGHTCQQCHNQGQYCMTPPPGYDNGYQSYDNQPNQPMMSPHGYGPMQPYQVVPEEQFRQQYPTPAPAPPAPDRTVPPSNLESSSPMEESDNSAMYRLQPNSGGYAHQPRYFQPAGDPVSEPAESQYKLLPQQQGKPQILRPAGLKIRNMFDAMKDRMPRLGRSADDLQQSGLSNPKATSERPAGGSYANQPVANVKSLPPAALARPEFNMPAQRLTADAIDPFAAPRTALQTKHEANGGVTPPAWGTHFPRQSHPSANAAPMMAVPQGATKIEQWPYSKRPQPISAAPINAPSTVPPQGL